MKSPLLNFGSNQVDLGGIKSPLSATSNNSIIEVGYIANETFISVSALFSNSLSHLMPPTKSILESVLGSMIPSNGART